MSRTNITSRLVRRPTEIKTKLDEHDTALDALEALTLGAGDFKQSVRAALTTNLTLSGEQTIDGVAVVAGDRVLAAGQTTSADKGIYVAAAGAWTRSTDMDVSSELTAGSMVYVSEGTVNGNHVFLMTADDAITIGVTSQTWAKLPNAADLAATTTGLGASLVGIYDVATKITATTVEGALAEIAADGYVTVDHLGTGAVTAAKLDSDAVTTVKILAANVTIPKLAANVAGGPQLLSGAGAIDLTKRTTLYTSTGGGQALTLADSTETGQRKTIVHHVDGGSGVITAGGSLHLGASIATITFTNVRDWVELEWDATNWNVVAYGGVTFA